MAGQHPPGFMAVPHWAREQDQKKCLCSKCGNSWLQLIEVNEYSDFNEISLAQKPPPLHGLNSFYLFKCIKCNELYEPQVIRNAGTIANRDRYNNLLDQLENIERVTGEDV